MQKKDKRTIFHIDVNSAFLSWTAAYRSKKGDTVDLRKIPSVIGGDEKSRRGVVLAKSIPAKVYGIVTGESLFSARRKCPDLTVVKPSFRIYEQYSRMLIETLKGYTTKIQKFSIDECFLDVTALKRYEEEPTKLAHEIKERIKRELGFTVNIGISNNKLLAKMASDFEKPDKVHTLYQWEIKKKMWPLPVGELFMVGRKSVPKLNNLNIYTIGDLAQYDINILTEKFKSKGILMWNYANGIDDSEVIDTPRKIQGISNETTLAYDITERKEAYKVLISLAEKVALRLRKSKKLCNSIAVNIRNNNFEDYSHQKKINYPTDLTEKIIMTTKELFDECWKGEPIRLLGIAVTNLCTNEAVQLSLFDNHMKVDQKQRSLDIAIDELRSKYGEKVVVRSLNIDNETK